MSVRTNQTDVKEICNNWSLDNNRGWYQYNRLFIGESLHLNMEKRESDTDSNLSSLFQDSVNSRVDRGTTVNVLGLTEPSKMIIGEDTTTINDIWDGTRFKEKDMEVNIRRGRSPWNQHARV